MPLVEIATIEAWSYVHTHLNLGGTDPDQLLESALRYAVALQLTGITPEDTYIEVYRRVWAGDHRVAEPRANRDQGSRPGRGSPAPVEEAAMNSDDWAALAERNRGIAHCWRHNTDHPDGERCGACLKYEAQAEAENAAREAAAKAHPLVGRVVKLRGAYRMDHPELVHDEITGWTGPVLRVYPERTPGFGATVVMLVDGEEREVPAGRCIPVEEQRS